MWLFVLGSVGTDPGAALADAARRYLDPHRRVQREDCSGWVDAVIEDALPVDLRGTPTVAQLRGLLPTLGWSVGWGSPQVGDVVFFHGTYDKDHDGARTRADRYTHVAVVLDVQGGVATLAHRGAQRGRSTISMNLIHPEDPGTNSLLLDADETAVGRVRRTGELFADLLRPPR